MLDNSKKQRILDASLQEFSEYGFEKASTDRICQKAGVSKGLLFHHFGSKEKLFMVTMNNCIDDILNEYNNRDYIEADFISIIMKMMGIKYDYFKKNPMHYKLVVNGFYNSPKKLKAELEQRYSELKQIGSNIFLEMIKTLPLKKDVSIENVLAILGSITNIVESKYLHYFTDEITSFEEFYNAAKNEYISLMNILLYGVIEK